MALGTQFKHPSLEEYLSRAKEWYTAWTKVYGVKTLAPWDTIAQGLKQEHAMVSKMDKVQQQVYWFEKAKKNNLVLAAEQERLNRVLTASKTRELAGQTLRDAKEQEAHARRRTSR